MKIDKELIEHVASVARLKLTKKEIEEFQPQLKEVISAFSKLQKIDTGGVEPSFQPVVLKNHLRKDATTDSLTQEEALSNSKNTKDGYFKGPRAV